MTTYLQLCNDLHEETGESGADLTTVSGLSGYRKKLTSHIKKAWEEIQTLHTDWRFLRMPALPTISASDASVDADSWVNTNLSTNIDYIHKDTFSIYLTATGISDESPLTYVPWEQWKERFGITYGDGAENRPTHITIDPDTGDLVFGPTSDGNYTIHFEFNRIPQVLSSDSDEPNIIDALTPIIVWRALERYGWSEESQAAISKGSMWYRRYLSRLEHRELPVITMGPPLA